MSKYPVSEMRLAIVTHLVREVLEKIPGVPWIIAAHNAVAYYNEHKEEIQKRELEFFDVYKDSFITANYIYNHRSEINECMPTDYGLYIVYARNNNGKILGVKLSSNKTEILDTFQSQKNIINGSVDRYNEKAEEVKKQFDLENEIEMLATIAQLPSSVD